MWAGCHQSALVGQYSIILYKQKIKNFVRCQIESMHTWQVLWYIELARAKGEALLNILIVKWNKKYNRVMLNDNDKTAVPKVSILDGDLSKKDT